MTDSNVLLMWGGAGTEHDISALSAAFIKQSLATRADFHVLCVELMQNGQCRNEQGHVCQLVKNINSGCNELVFSNGVAAPWQIDFVIPCFHGFPGESGDIQSLLTLLDVPFLGCHAEASSVCFNKVTTKLWLDALGIPNTAYIVLSSPEPEQIKKACKALAQWSCVFVKASSQGSSVGCYKVNDEAMLRQRVIEAFSYSPYVLIEQCVNARELEVAVYEYNDELVATAPGEIHSPEGSFYTFDEKYKDNSRSTTDVVASDLTSQQIDTIKHYALAAFIGLKLRHLSRVDFFLLENGDILLNEINTLPGMTPISMFPKMMEHHGHAFSEFMGLIIDKSAAN